MTQYIARLASALTCAARCVFQNRATLVSSASRTVAFLLAYTALAILFTWPLAAHISTDVTSAVDPVDSIWRIGWHQYRLLHDLSKLLAGNTFYPFANSLFFDECLLGVAILTLPLAIIGLTPLAIYNVSILITLALCGLTMYALARHFGAVRVAAFAAGMIYAFAPLHLDQIGHIGVLSIQWFPLILLYLDRTLARPSWRNTFILALCLVLQALSSQYHALFLVLLVPLFLAVMFARRPDARRLITIGHLSVAGSVAIAVVAPVAISYLRVRHTYDVSRTYSQTAYYGASLVNFITPDNHNRLWGALTAGLRQYGTYTFERGMFAGAGALILAGIGIWLGRRTPWVQFLTLLTVVSAVLALGPELRVIPGQRTPLLGYLPYALAYWHLPGVDSMRVPARIGALYVLGVAGLVACTLTVIIRRVDRLTMRPRARKLGRIAPSLVSALVLFGIGAEYLNAPLSLVSLATGATVPPVYQWLAAQPDAIVLELPLVIPDHNREQALAVQQQYFSLIHRQLLVNGNATVLPKGYKALVQEMHTLPSPRSVALLQGLGITYVVIHYDQLIYLKSPRLRAELSAGNTGLSLAAQFNDGSVEVYRVARTGKYEALRAALPVGNSIALSREDPAKIGGYMAMIGYVLRDHPLFANQRVDFGQQYQGPVQPGAHYDAAVFFADEDPVILGFTAADLVWQDGVARAYHHGRTTGPDQRHMPIAPMSRILPPLELSSSGVG